MADIIGDFFGRQQELYEHLTSTGMVSFAQDVESSSRKNLALAIASFFESEIGELICKFASERTNNCMEIVSFVRNKGLNRQFHTLFNWGGNNANSFFSLFGKEFKEKAEKSVKESEDLDLGVKAFLQLGDLRNQIVHENYAAFVTDKTAKEIFESYGRALKFIEFLRGSLV